MKQVHVNRNSQSTKKTYGNAYLNELSKEKKLKDNISKITEIYANNNKKSSNRAA